MPQQEYAISDIINFAKNSQVNSQLAIQGNLIFNSGSLNTNYSRELYLVRRAVEFVYNANPTYPTLRQVAEFLYALSRPFIINAATISITNPVNQVVNVGQTASFSVSVFVSNATPYTVQWFRNNVAIPGATSTTYQLANAQLTDNGAQFSAVATATGVGQAVSTTATITVIQQIVGFFSFSASVDYYPILLTNSDPFNYNISFPITHNSPISFNMPASMPANQYMLVKVPATESIKTVWFNTPLNNGTIPDSVFQNIVQFGGFTYYASRGQISMDVSQPLQLS
jgi:hypothetical protein